jgi:hypothetical protein
MKLWPILLVPFLIINMGYLLPMVEMGIVEFTQKIRDRICRVFNRDMNGDGLMVEVGWRDLFSKNLWWWIGLRGKFYGVLELGRG